MSISWKTLADLTEMHDLTKTNKTEKLNCRVPANVHGLDDATVDISFDTLVRLLKQSEKENGWNEHPIEIRSETTRFTHRVRRTRTITLC